MSIRIPSEMDQLLEDAVRRKSRAMEADLPKNLEQEIRNKIGARTTDLLRRVFALQD